MPHQAYYPRAESAQLLWLSNYKGKIPVHGVTVGFLPAELTATNNDLAMAMWLLETFSPAVQSDAKEATAFKKLMLESPPVGALSTPIPVGTVFASPPALVLPGVLKRLFNQVARIKVSIAYTEAMGTDLGIIGKADAAEHPVPVFSVKVADGPGQQSARIKFTKFGHDGVYIESRRNAGAWGFLAIDTQTPYVDATPLLAPPAPETREYRMRFWDAGEGNGDWTAVAKVVVGM